VDLDSTPHYAKLKKKKKLTTLLKKTIIVAKSKEVKTGSSNSTHIWKNLPRKAVAQKGCFANDDDE
jgi:hypothetical protein